LVWGSAPNAGRRHWDHVPRASQFARCIDIKASHIVCTDAWEQVKSWLDCDPVWIPGPTEKHQQILEPLLAAIGGRSNLVPDAHLAALALEHGLILCSTDGDFARFHNLRWENPLR
jgi:predicted nucleic acid-binding protein